MQKNTLFAFALLACLGTAVPASANQGQKEDCDKSGGEWRPFSGVPQCNCDKRQDLFPLLAPGSNPALIAIRNKAKVTKDVCESRDIAKTSANIDKGKEKTKTDKPVTQKAPVEIVFNVFGPATQDASTPAMMTILASQAYNRVGQVIMSCDVGCKVNGETVRTENPMFQKGTPKHTMTLTSTGKETGTVTVTLVPNDGKVAPQPVSATVQWTTKTPVAAPAPPPPPSPCVQSEGIDTTTLEGKKGCACLPKNGIERVAVNGVCVEKPKAAVEDEWDGGLHLYAKLNAGYGGSSTFRTPFYGLIVGLSFDLDPMVKAYGGAGFSLPGAKLDATQDRVAMDRSYSSNFEAGLMLLPIVEIELKAGVWYRATGLDGASSPIRNLIAATVGVGYSPPISGVRLSVGPEFYLGADKQGGISAKAFFGGGITLTAEFFNEPNRGKK